MRRKIRVPDGVEDAREGEADQRATIASSGASAFESDAFLTLRATLRYVIDELESSIMVVSPMVGDWKSTVAYGLAVTMAAAGDSVRAR